MKFYVLTLFPNFFDSFLETSIIGKAIESEKIEVEVVDIRDYSTNKHRKVDDVPYGGGAGMVMMCQPLFDAINQTKQKAPNAPVIFFTPSENVWKQEFAENFASGITPDTKFKEFDSVILLCGRYEGIDQRVRDSLVDFEISMGNYILTGGELPAQIFIDSVSRLIPGVISKEESHQQESFSVTEGRDWIEHAHYTRPEEYEGMKVPEVLLSGHHAKIEEWRKQGKIR